MKKEINIHLNLDKIKIFNNKFPSTNVKDFYSKDREEELKESIYFFNIRI